jgi:hypothetical protein
MLYIANAFSLGMVPRGLLHRVRCDPIAPPVLGGVDFISAVGHADTAMLLGVPMARISIALQPGDVLYVAQYVGQRLPEGATELPPGARFDWVAVRIMETKLSP